MKINKGFVAGGIGILLLSGIVFALVANNILIKGNIANTGNVGNENITFDANIALSNNNFQFSKEWTASTIQSYNFTIDTSEIIGTGGIFEKNKDLLLNITMNGLEKQMTNNGITFQTQVGLNTILISLSAPSNAVSFSGSYKIIGSPFS